jgi:hypothetical protein
MNAAAGHALTRAPTGPKWTPYATLAASCGVVSRPVEPVDDGELEPGPPIEEMLAHELIEEAEEWLAIVAQVDDL